MNTEVCLYISRETNVCNCCAAVCAAEDPGGGGHVQSGGGRHSPAGVRAQDRRAGRGDPAESGRRHRPVQRGAEHDLSPRPIHMHPYKTFHRCI